MANQAEINAQSEEAIGVIDEVSTSVQTVRHEGPGWRPVFIGAFLGMALGALTGAGETLTKHLVVEHLPFDQALLLTSRDTFSVGASLVTGAMIGGFSGDFSGSVGMNISLRRVDSALAGAREKLQAFARGYKAGSK